MKDSDLYQPRTIHIRIRRGRECAHSQFWPMIYQPLIVSSGLINLYLLTLSFYLLFHETICIWYQRVWLFSLILSETTDKYLWNLLCISCYWRLLHFCTFHFTTITYSNMYTAIRSQVDWWYLAINTAINKNKPIALLTLVLFNGCYMFQSAYGTIFRQSHQLCL
jgi:hypothetical protein